jgi:hypothetical protein
MRRYFHIHIVKALLRSMSRARKKANIGSGRSKGIVLTWPPVSSAREATELSIRLQWLLPRWHFDEPVMVPCTKNVNVRACEDLRSDILAVPPRQRAQIRLVSNFRDLGKVPEPFAVLLWKLFHPRSLAVLNRRERIYLIDPDGYFASESEEWNRLYLDYGDPKDVADLESISKSNFKRLLDQHARPATINVCGTGPGLQQISHADTQSCLNVVCNSAVQSEQMMQQLRPAIIAFFDGVYFGPSLFASDYVRQIIRWVEEFGSFVFVPEGYAHFLLRSNYPALASNLIGLKFKPTAEPVPLGLDYLCVTPTANIVTSFMMPAAFSLSPSEIRIWGCDGWDPQQKGRWSYMSGIERPYMNQNPVKVHPAFYKDQDSQLHYEFHCAYFEKLLAFIERSGVRVICSSPSFIPALQKRRPDTSRAMTEKVTYLGSS